MKHIRGLAVQASAGLAVLADAGLAVLADAGLAVLADAPCGAYDLSRVNPQNVCRA